ncbi:2-oxoacid:acceptor oxidoreductase family protein [Chloroflexota bacterium]
MGDTQRFTFLVAGEAGHGVRRAGIVAADLFGEWGRYVFQMDDYQSLIRGGHNFSVVSSSTTPVLSQYMRADLVVALDARSIEKHREHLSPSGVLVYNSDAVGETVPGAIGLPLSTLAKGYTHAALRLGVAAVSVLAARVGMTRSALEGLIGRKYERDAEGNALYALSVFDEAVKAVAATQIEHGDAPATMLTGNEAIGLGAYAGGLDIYFAYPMTPASSVLHYLAAHAREFGITVVHPESEIAVMNMAIGAASVGARTAVGSSGGGVALMEEAMSLAGMSETPIMCVLSSRPGPSTGVPTYTAQADLSFALNQGHGEFARIVASPATVEEAYRIAAQLMSLSWAFQIPSILLTEKHLSESRMTVSIPDELPSEPDPVMDEAEQGYARYSDTPTGVSPLRFAPSDAMIKWTSYEHDEKGITTEDPDMICLMQEKRRRKRDSVVVHLKSRSCVNRFGETGPLIVTYGSTTMSVLEALSCGDLNARVVQPVYLEPFPEWEFADLAGEEAVVVEQSCDAQFAELLRRRTNLKVIASVLQYDGRPFDPEDLARRLKEVL